MHAEPARRCQQPPQSPRQLSFTSRILSPAIITLRRVMNGAVRLTEASDLTYRGPSGKPRVNTPRLWFIEESGEWGSRLH